MLRSGDPEVTIIGTTPGDDHSLRSSCIHYELILKDEKNENLMENNLHDMFFPTLPWQRGPNGN